MSERTENERRRLEGVELGSIRLETHVGHDGAGDVYRALDTKLRRTVRVRVLDAREVPESLTRAARVAHPALVPIHDVVAGDGVVAIVQDDLALESLKDRQELGPLPRAEAGRLVATIAGALAALHDEGAAHGSLAADRVLLLADGRAVLRDAGIVAGDESTDLRALGALITELLGDATPRTPEARRERALWDALTAELRAARPGFPLRGARGVAERLVLFAEPPSRTPAIARRVRRAKYPLLAASVVAMLLASLALIDGPLRGWRREPVAVLPFAAADGSDESLVAGERLGTLVRERLGESRRLRPFATAAIEGTGPGGLATEAGDALLTRGAEGVVGGAVELTASGQRARVRLVRASGGAEDHVVEAANLEDLARDVASLVERRLTGEARGERSPAGQGDALDDAAQRALARVHSLSRELRYAEAIVVAERLAAKHPGALETRLALAEVLATAGFERRARDAARAAQEIAKAQDVLDDETGLRVKAIHARAFGRHHERARLAVLLATRRPDDTTRALQAALALEASGNIDGAQLWVERAHGEPLAELLAARLSFASGERERAYARLEAARREFDDLGMTNALAVCDETEGDFAVDSGEFVAAVSAYERARSRIDSRGLPARAARLESLAADALVNAGDLEGAAGRYRTSLPVLEAEGAYSYALEAEAAWGAQLYLAGRFDEAEAKLRRALDRARLLENDRLFVEPAVNLANLLVYTGRGEEGAALAAIALERSLAVRRDDIAFFARVALAAAEAQRGGVRAAAAIYRTMIEAEARPSGSKEREAYAHVALADALLEVGDAESGFHHATRAVALNRERRARVDLGYALATHARALAALDRDREARASLDEAEQLARDGGGELADLLAVIAKVRAELRAR